MAAKMGKAREQRNQASEVRASEYDKITHGAMVCYHCRCPVEGVGPYTRNVGDNQISVAAFFRLPKFAETKGNGHKRGCRFNIDEMITRLVARSMEIKHLDRDAEPILAAVRGGKIEYRLHILMESLRYCRYDRWNSSGDYVGNPPSIGTRYVRSSRTLTPYLRVAKGVLSLIARVQDQPELADQITLKYAHYTIPWDEYFFDLSQYCELYEHFSTHEELRIPGLLGRPVALVVKIADGSTPLLTQYGHWQVRGSAHKCNSDTFGPFRVQPMLYFRQEDLALKALKDKVVLVCAVPKVKLFRNPMKPWLDPYGDVSLDIINRAQVCKYAPMMM